jgi:hypothetical protein
MHMATAAGRSEASKCGMICWQSLEAVGLSFTCCCLVRACRTELCHRHDERPWRAVTGLTRLSLTPVHRVDVSRTCPSTLHRERSPHVCLLQLMLRPRSRHRWVSATWQAREVTNGRLHGCCLFAATVSDPNRRRLCGAARAGWRRYPMSWPRSSVEHLVERGGSISDKRMQLIPGATLAVTFSLADLPPSNHTLFCLAKERLREARCTRVRCAFLQEALQIEQAKPTI